MNELFSNIKSLKKIYILVLSFIIIAIINSFFSNDEFAKKILNLVINYIKNIKFNVLSIFLNNLKVSLFITFGGFLLLLPTLFIGYLNFYILGLIFNLSLKENKLNVFLASVLPHGIIELFAIFLSLTLGTSLFFSLIKFNYFEERKFSKVLKLSLITYIFIVLPLLFISALIEVYITPKIIELLGIEYNLFNKF